MAWQYVIVGLIVAAAAAWPLLDDLRLPA